MSAIKDDNYLTIQGWMINQFGLKGNELIIYAAIYGFTQAEGQWFTGSQQYLADWTNSTTRGVRKALTALEEKGLVIIAKNGKGNKYRAVRPEIEDKNSSKDTTQEQSSSKEKIAEQSSSEQRNKVPLIAEQSSDNNIDIYIDNNISKKEGSKKSSYENIIDSFNLDPKLQQVLIEYIKMRKLINAPLTDYGFRTLIDELLTLDSDTDKLIKIVNNAILTNSRKFYSLDNPKETKRRWNYSQEHSRDKQYAELEDKILNAADYAVNHQHSVVS